MGEENLEDHPNWNAILQWSLRFQEQPSENRVLEPMDQERREFLTRALADYAAAIDDPVRSMRGYLEVIKNPDSPKDQCIEALEELAFHAEDIDQANDLYLIGGLQVCCAYIKHPDPDLQSLACEVIGNAVQNNEKIVQFATETFVLGDLLNLADTSDHQNVKIKSILAISCLVRGNKSALDRYNELEGYNVIVRAVQSPINKVQLKSIFLISNVCVVFPDQCQIYVSMGLPQQLFAMCGKFVAESESRDINLVQSTLRLLLTLVTNYKVQLPSDAAATLTALKESLGDGENTRDEKELCAKLLKLCPTTSETVDR